MSRWQAPAGVVLGALAVAAGGTDLALRLASGGEVWDNVASGDLVAIGYGLAGGYLVRARPRNAVGWVLLAVAVLQGLTGAASAYATAADPSALRTWAAWLASWVWFPGFALLPTLLVSLYPTGRASGRRRVLVGTSLAGGLLLGLCLALSVDGVDDIVAGVENPVAAPSLAVVLGVAGAVLLLPSVVVTLVDAGLRLWRGRSPEREQLAWLLTAVVVAVALNYLPVGALAMATSVLVPGAVAVGVLRHRLLDLQVVVRRTLLFAALTGLVVAVFAATTATLSAVVPDDSLSVAVAAGLVSVGLLPARDVLQRAVDRLVYGDRRDPLRAVASLGRHLAEQDDARLVPQVLRTVAAAVRSPHVVLLDEVGGLVAEAGTPGPGDALELPLHVAGRQIGCLRVAPRTPRDRWSADDRQLLDLLARQVAAVAHAARLNTELAGSRDRVVQATAEERQRLHQELHDGLGPALSGIALGLEAAEAAWDRSPERVPALLSRLRQESQTAGREVRRLVEGLRPAALDRQGLAAALTSFVAGLRDSAAGRLDVALELPDALPALSPEAEAAAYRIVAEAVTNVVRHSGATSCRVVLAADPDGLRMVVEDDGNGLPAQPREGVGLASMRRRAAGLGGTWDAGPRHGGGTRIEVVLPPGRSAEVTA